MAEDAEEKEAAKAGVLGFGETKLGGDEEEEAERAPALVMKGRERKWRPRRRSIYSVF